MTFWDFLEARWPSERAWVTILLAILIGSLLKMAEHDPALWDVELFKTLLTATVVTGALNMVLPFHYAANKTDEKKTENTAAAFEAIRETAKASQGENAEARGAQDAADAAQVEADSKKTVDTLDGGA